MSQTAFHLVRILQKPFAGLSHTGLCNASHAEAAVALRQTPAHPARASGQLQDVVRVRPCPETTRLVAAGAGCCTNCIHMLVITTSVAKFLSDAPLQEQSEGVLGSINLNHHTTAWCSVPALVFFVRRINVSAQKASAVLCSAFLLSKSSRQGGTTYTWALSSKVHDTLFRELCIFP